MSTLLQNHIGGKLVKSTSIRQIEIIDPATESYRCSIPASNGNDVDKAVIAAQQALEGWRHTPPIARARILFRFRDLLEQQKKTLADLISKEHGKTHEDAMAELSRAMDVLEFACGIPQLLKGEHSRNSSLQVDTWSLMQPVGVCAGITPFNFPAMVPLWMFPIALGCGNTFILKPSEKDPSAPSMFPELLHDAGLPDGVFNLIHGDSEAVDCLLKHAGVNAVSFVGSTPVAEHVYKIASGTGKRVQALGGAKNHAIVMPDADLDEVAGQVTGAAFGSTGERCMAISVVVTVGDDTGSKLVERLSSRISKLSTGAYHEKPDMGPLINRQQKERVLSLIESGINEGASLIVDGRVTSNKNGWFVGGCLFDHVTPDMQIYQKEIFGPVLCVVRAENYQEALKISNSPQYGNGSAIFTRCGKTAQHFCEQSETGMVGINVPIPVPVAWHCFGGWKRSLFGPLHMHGPDGVRFYTRMKTITARWPQHTKDQELTMPVVG